MIKGVGIDILDIKRIKSIMEKFGEKFYEKILTEKEIAYCKSYKAVILRWNNQQIKE